MTAAKRIWLYVGLIPLLACMACLLVLQIKDEKVIPFYAEVNVKGMTEKVTPWENADGEYYVFLPGYANAENVKFSLNTDDVRINNVKLTEGMNVDVFALDTPYEMTYASWGKEQTRKITFVQSANVATMHIDTASGSMNYIHAEKGNEEQGKIRLYTAEGELNYDGELTINGRGNSTWTFQEKKPYSIKITDEVDLLEMGAAQKWVLLANGNDSSNLRNKIIYDFAEEVGLAYSPNSQWVDLYLNGDYAGLYLLSERNEVHSERVDISTETGYLVSLEEKSRLALKNDNYVTTAAGQTLGIHYPQIIDDDAMQKVAVLFQTIENALLSDDGIDKTTGKYWTELIDFESWAKKYLIEEIFANNDACYVSQYFYYETDQDAAKAYAGPVWDYDKAIGVQVNWQFQSPNAFYANRLYVGENNQTPWFYNLYQKDEFYKCLTEIYETVYLPELFVLLHEKMEIYTEQIEKADKLNRIRWNIEKSFEEDFRQITDFISRRIEFLTSIWIDGEVYYTVQAIPKNNTYRAYYTIRSGESLTVLPVLPDTDYQTFLGWYYADTNEPFDSTRPIMEDTEIYAKWADSSYKKKEQILKLMPLAVIACMGVCVLWADIRRMRKGG